VLAVVKDPAKRGIVLEDVPVPTVGPWEVLVRVRAAGICGSDQRIYNEVNPARRRRFIIGHEIAGEVVAVGERVTEVRQGAPVAVEICIGCGICRHCKVGRINLCEKLEELGVTVDGGMTELVAVPGRNVHVLPSGLSFEAAVLADPLACVIRGLEMITVTSGSWVAVLGPGQMGLLATQVIKRILRARVVVIGTRDDRLALARSMGADETVNVRERDAVAAVRELTDGGADFVYEAAGNAEALGQGIAMARKGPQAGSRRPRARRARRAAPGGCDLLLVPGIPAGARAPGAGPPRRRAAHAPRVPARSGAGGVRVRALAPGCQGHPRRPRPGGRGPGHAIEAPGGGRS
jgi:L-iditol 2-dehydrogenase